MKLDTRVEVPEDDRVAYGVLCAWWDDVANVGKHAVTGLPCCPHCKGLLYEMPRAEWETATKLYAASSADLAEYPDFVAWLKGKCFPNYNYAKQAYAVHKKRSMH
jgi:hypothetical protein